MGEVSAVENGPLVGAESTDGLSPTICHVLNNAIKNKFQVRGMRLCLWTLVPLQEATDETVG